MFEVQTSRLMFSFVGKYRVTRPQQRWSTCLWRQSLNVRCRKRLQCTAR